MEVNNHETFDRRIEIFNSNSDSFDLEFSFVGTGIAKIHKMNKNKLFKRKKMNSRKMSFLNFVRKSYKIFDKIINFQYISKLNEKFKLYFRIVSSK